MSVLIQFFKFGIVGGLNTLVDIVILNILIQITGLATGWPFAIFKGISFIVAVANSFILNRRWTFARRDNSNPTEVWQFFAVSFGGLFINVGIASFIVNGLAGWSVALVPLSSQLATYGLSVTVAELWANTGTLVAVAASLIWNFIGYKFFVFKK